MLAYRGDRRVWPLAVQSLMKQQCTEPTVDAEGACLCFVENILHDLHEQEQHCQWQLLTRAQTVSGYTRILDFALQKFVQQGLELFRVDMDRQMASIRYHYNETLLQHAYLAECTDPSQVRVSFSRCSTDDCTQSTIEYIERSLRTSLQARV